LRLCEVEQPDPAITADHHRRPLRGPEDTQCVSFAARQGNRITKRCAFLRVPDAYLSCRVRRYHRGLAVDVNDSESVHLAIVAAEDLMRVNMPAPGPLGGPLTRYLEPSHLGGELIVALLACVQFQL